MDTLLTPEQRKAIARDPHLEFDEKLDKAIESQDAQTKRGLVKWAENYTSGDFHNDRIVAGMVQALKREVGL